MGLNTWTLAFFAAILAFILFFSSALAAGPIPITPDPPRLQSTHPQTITIPFEFEPVPVSTPEHTPMPDFIDISFVNDMGSYALTLFAMLDALAFLGILVVLYLVVRFLMWLYRFVTEYPTQEKLDLSGGLEVAGDVTGDEDYYAYSRATKKTAKFFGKNPFRF